LKTLHALVEFAMEILFSIKDWYDCALKIFPSHSPPDIHPHEDAWGVTLEAQSGRTYLGLVVRHDESESREIVSQKLSSPLLPGQCYEFSVHLSQSEVYMGQRRLAPLESSFESTYSDPYLTPVILCIWGGVEVCDFEELLGSSKAVSNHDWQDYTFTFMPQKELSFISIEAYYSDETQKPYNGHILLDNCSAITPVPCE
jgi:hypothetical protein